MYAYIYALLICITMLTANGTDVEAGSGHIPETAYEQKIGEAIVNFYLKSNNNLASSLKIILKYELTGEAKQKAMAGIKELEATNVKLQAIKRRLQGDKLQPAEIQKLMQEAVKIEYNNKVVQGAVTGQQDRDPGMVIIGGVGYPVIKIPPSGPDDNCEAAGDGIKSDCMNGVNTMFNCGIMSAADKTLARFNCQFAGVAEENKCELANMQGNSYIPTESHFSSEAEAQCNAFKETGGANTIPQTRTSTGN